MGWPRSFYGRVVTAVDWAFKMSNPPQLGGMSFQLRHTYQDDAVEKDVLERALKKGSVYVKLKDPRLAHIPGKGFILYCKGIQTDEVYFSN